MVHEGIVEPFEHAVRKASQLLFGKVQRLHQLVEHHHADIPADDFIAAGVPHYVYAREEGNRRKHGMGTVQERDLALVVGLLGRDEKHVEPCLVGWEFFRYRLRGLYHPEVEGLPAHHHVVVVAELRLDAVDVLFRESRHYAVDERGIYGARVLEPLPEAVAELPELYVLVYRLFQSVAVKEYEFAGEDYEPLGGVASEEPEPVVQQLCKFARV